MANRNRPIQVKFRVTPEERKMIDRRMEQAGINNMAAYLRKMAIDGYVVKPVSASTLLAQIRSSRKE